MKCQGCGKEMTRKGRNKTWFKCKACGMRFVDGQWLPRVSRDSKWAHDEQIRDKRRELSNRKIIKKLKSSKYSGLDSIRLQVDRVLQYVNLDDYDKTGERKQKEKSQVSAS